MWKKIFYEHFDMLLNFWMAFAEGRMREREEAKFVDELWLESIYPLPTYLPTYVPPSSLLNKIKTLKVHGFWEIEWKVKRINIYLPN